MKGLADLIDSDIEDSQNFIDENSILSSASDATQATADAPNKRGKKRHKVTMPKSKSRVTKTAQKPPAKLKKVNEPKRKALEGLVNDRLLSEPVADAHSDDEDVRPLAQNKSRGRVAGKAKGGKKTAVEDPDETMEINQTPAAARSSHATTKSRKPTTKVAIISGTDSKNASSKAEPEVVVRETQAEQMEIESEDENIPDVRTQAPPASKTRGASAIRQHSNTRRRAGSASDTERGDPNLRRKLGDMTRKFENIDSKYRNLREVGIVEANANMDKLRRQCEATTQASNELIASLRKELATHAPLAQETRKLQKQVQTYESETVELRNTATELATALQSAQNDIKALQAKLAAARTAPPAETATNRPPGSAMKAIVPARNNKLPGTDATYNAQSAQMKEDLYSDLTGLIVRSVKKTEEGDTYDCIQTGRNGTLHFKLFVDAEEAKTASFEDTEFLYLPMLDANRDREMIEMMPNYLTEEITFARQNAAKFYGRVVDSLTKRRTEE